MRAVRLAWLVRVLVGVPLVAALMLIAGASSASPVAASGGSAGAPSCSVTGGLNGWCRVPATIPFTFTVTPLPPNTSGTDERLVSVVCSGSGVSGGESGPVQTTQVVTATVNTSSPSTSGTTVQCVGQYQLQSVVCIFGTCTGSGWTSGPTVPLQQTAKVDLTLPIGSAAVTPNPSVVGQPLSAHWVTLTDGLSGINSAVTSCQTPSSATPGTRTLTCFGADMAGNSINPTIGYTVNKANTTTTITGHTPAPSVVGQSVTINFSVAANAPGAGTPTGNVTVTDSGSSDTCTATVAAGSCTIAFSQAGDRSLTAVYSGDSNYNASPASVAVTQHVDKATTTLSAGAKFGATGVVGQGIETVATVSVTSPGGGTPTGAITYVDGTDSCTSSVAAGGDCFVALSTAGTHHVTVTYAGDGNYLGSGTSLDYTINQAITTTTITGHAPNPSVYGQPVTVQYTVAVNLPGHGTPTGLVTVIDGYGDTCSATVATGQCAIVLTHVGPVGSVSVQAKYAGDTNFLTSTSSAPFQTVNKASTTTSISSDSPDPSTVGQAVTVQYAVAGGSPGSGAPTGTVTVGDGVNSCNGTIAAGQCVITLNTLGSRPLTASYGGDANFSSSTSAAAAHTVGLTGTTTSIDSDLPDPSVVGQVVTVHYSVGVVSPGTGTPTGTVTVGDGVTSCSASVATGQCDITFNSAGSHPLTATYGGDSTFNGSSSSSAAHTVNLVTTTTSITSDSPDPSDVGQTVTVHYTVGVVSPGTGTPTGQVTVSDGLVSCSNTAAAGQCDIVLTKAGSRPLHASYAGDSKFNASSTSADEPHTVNQVSTTTSITSDSPDSSVVGQVVTVHYSVTASGTPTGQVTVTDGQASCSASVATGQCDLALTTAGARPLTASYEGDATFAASVSSAEPHTVNQADTTTSIDSDPPDPSVTGQTITVHYSVAAAAPGAGTPTGQVTVTDGTTTCKASVAAGQCDLTLPTAGSHTLSASYGGDAQFNTSTSADASHTVNQAVTSTTITSDDPDPSVFGQVVSVHFSVAVTGAGAGSPTGLVTVSDNIASCSAAVSVGHCDIDFTKVGSRPLHASYAGDSDFSASTTAADEPHTVNDAATTTTITTHTPNPSLVGQAVTVQYTVTVDAPGSGTATGTVTVGDGVDSCNASVAAGQCDITLTTVGTRTLTASYVGDAGFADSDSPGTSHTVNAGVVGTTTSIVSDVPDPSAPGQAVLVTYTVVATDASTATGNVTVSGGGANCIATVAAGQCSLSISHVGSTPITASYAGDAGHSASASTAQAHLVHYVFTLKGPKAPPLINAGAAGAKIPIKFSLGKSFGLTILTPGFPKMQVVSCSTWTGTHAAVATNPAGSAGLTYNAATKTYTYSWQTTASWFTTTPTCRLLTVGLKDGTTHVLRYKFSSRREAKARASLGVGGIPSQTGTATWAGDRVIVIDAPGSGRWATGTIASNRLVVGSSPTAGATFTLSFSTWQRAATVA